MQANIIGPVSPPGVNSAQRRAAPDELRSSQTRARASVCVCKDAPVNHRNPCGFGLSDRVVDERTAGDLRFNDQFDVKAELEKKRDGNRYV